MKVVLAGFYYETNTFAPVTPAERLFRQSGIWLRGPSAVRAWALTRHGDIAGGIETLEKSGHEAVAVFAAASMAAGGRLDAAGFARLREDMLGAIHDALPADAVILNLHGAACAEGLDDTEGSLLAGLRNELGFKGRVGVSLDLHANITAAMLEHADAITAFHTFPHVDQYETGARTARLALKADCATLAAAKIRMLLPPTTACDSHPAFAAMQARARAMEGGDIDDVTLLPVQPWLDVAELGSAVLVSGRGDAPAEAAETLAAEWYAGRGDYPSRLMPDAAILARLRERRTLPWALVDAADAVTGGATGRSAYAIALLLPHADALPGPVLLHVVDPDAVDAAERGARSFLLGDRRTPVTAERVRLTEGRGVMRKTGYRGMAFTIGGGAVLERGMLRILVCREATGANTDPAFYEAAGLDPSSALAVHVKSLSGWMAGYDAGPERGLYLDGPGATALDFASLPFRPEQRGLYPIAANPPAPVALWRRAARMNAGAQVTA